MRRFANFLSGLILLSLLFFSSLSLAAPQTRPSKMSRATYLGHNLSISTETPKAGTVAVGSYLLGYSPSDRLLIGTSPWMIFDYNTYNVVTRYNIIRDESDELTLDGDDPTDSGGAFDALTVQVAYMKSGNFARDFYRQEIAIVWLTGKVAVNPYYDFYLTGNYMYFFDETIPFSLRREPFNDEKYQLSLSSLHSLKVNDLFRVSLEFGVLGLRSSYPQIHSGVSFSLTKGSYLIQLGFSVTATPYNFERFLESSTNAKPEGNYYDASVHPEIQLQYFF